MAVSGLYISEHPWLAASAHYKVGFSRDLRRRLHDSCYVTCFSPEWRYVATFETRTGDDAELLETYVLRYFEDARPYGNELVRAPVERIVAAAAAIAEALKMPVTRRQTPTYRRPPSRRPGTPPSRVVGGAGEPLDETVFASIRLADTDRSDIGAAAEPEDERAVAELEDGPGAAAARNDMAKAEPEDQSAAADPAALEDQDDAETLLHLADEPFDLDAAENPPDAYAVAAFVAEERAYQRDAVEHCLQDLGAAGRTTLAVACRCGKTKIAYDIMAQGYLAHGKKVLILVPGLALLRQTAQKLVAYGLRAPLKLVGSDAAAVPLAGRAAATMTTDWRLLAAFVAQPGARVVLSTYHSSGLTSDSFDLIVFDEAHRVCGDATERPFNYALVHHGRGHRLFMTATPRYDAEISMKDRTLFGGVGYRYHLRQGIDAGYVNDFRLDLVVAPPAAAAAAADLSMARQVCAAMGRSGVDKMLVFCRDIAHIHALCVRTAHLLREEPELAGGAPPFACYEAHSRLLPEERGRVLREFGAPGVRAVLFNCRMFQEGVEIPLLNAVFFAAPRHSPIEIIQSLCRPLNRLSGKPPSVVFVPVLSDPALASTDPKNLRRYASIVPFIDALLDEDPTLYEHLLEAGRGFPFGCFSVLGRHSLPGAACASVLAAVKRAVRYGPGGAQKTNRLLKASRLPWDWGFRELSRVVRECRRYPKTVDAAEIAPGVYIHFYRWYRWALAAYDAGKIVQTAEVVCDALDGARGLGKDVAKHVCAFAGLALASNVERETALEPYQIAQLEALPGWALFGRGPYPWKECMAYFEKWLETHDGVPPMVEINRGGYVGLDATWMERLSGTFTCVNQGDGKDRKGGAPGSGFTVSEAKQRDLDRVCGRFGLRWRKDRDAAGGLLVNKSGRYVGRETFIQRANKLFQKHYQNDKRSPYLAEHFPGYDPESVKYKYQEHPDVFSAKLMPPKWAHVKPGAKLKAPKRRWR